MKIMNRILSVVAAAALAAGLLREPLLPFLLLVGLAKLGRYLVIAWLVL